MVRLHNTTKKVSQMTIGLLREPNLQVACAHQVDLSPQASNSTRGSRSCPAPRLNTHRPLNTTNITSSTGKGSIAVQLGQATRLRRHRFESDCLLAIASVSESIRDAYGRHSYGTIPSGTLASAHNKCFVATARVARLKKALVLPW